MLQYILCRIEQLKRDTLASMRKPAQQEPIIIGLFQLLPPIGSEWPRKKRVAFLNAMEKTLDMLYCEEDAIQ